ADARGRCPFHRILLGQIAFVALFDARSLASHALGLPGLGRAELWALVAAALGAALHCSLRARRAGARRWTRRDAAWTATLCLLWTAWWLSTVWYLGVRRGGGGAPSAGPGALAYLGQRAAAQGRVQ